MSDHKHDEKVTTTQVTNVVHQTATSLNLLPKEKLKYEVKEQYKSDRCNMIVLFDHTTQTQKKIKTVQITM